MARTCLAARRCRLCDGGRRRGHRARGARGGRTCAPSGPMCRSCCAWGARGRSCATSCSSSRRTGASTTTSARSPTRRTRSTSRRPRSAPSRTGCTPSPWAAHLIRCPRTSAHNNPAWTTAYRQRRHGRLLPRSAARSSRAPGRTSPTARCRPGRSRATGPTRARTASATGCSRRWRGASFANNVFAVAAQSGRYSTLLERRAIYGIPMGSGRGPAWGCDNSADASVSMIDLEGKLSHVFPASGSSRCRT